MHEAQVRAILCRHAAGQPDPAGTDPNELVPAERLHAALAGCTDAEQRARAVAYARLWGRTFRTLVTHLRGQPGRALALFTDEVYPHLRGDRLAARVERVGAGHARILLADDLPSAYVAGLVEGFVALSGAQATATALGSGVVDVRVHLPAHLRLVRVVAHATALRLPLLACAVLATFTGAALASVVGPIDAGHLWVTLAGVLAAQIGANALHGLRRRPGNPFAPGHQPSAVWLAQAVGGYALALAAGAWLILATTPAVLVFAALGLVSGLAYGRFRDQGLGPAVAAVTYGLLIPAGVVAVLQPSILASPVAVLLAGAPLGLMAAALLLLDNLADRPLDEAGGQRTLAVRLPPGRNGLAFAGLLGMALLWVGALGVLPDVTPGLLVGALALALPTFLLGRHVRSALADPHALAPARLGTFALLLAVALLPILFLAEALA